MLKGQPKEWRKEKNMKNTRSAKLFTDSALIVLPMLMLLLIGALLSIQGPVSGADPVTGAIWTTDPNGERVNGNLYNKATDVYIMGGPHKQGAAGLPDGVYYFQVTDPPGKTLLSTEDDIEDRRFEVKNGEIDNINGGTHEWNPDTTRGHGIVVQLWPFGPTPNKGGVYKVWVTNVDYYSPLEGCFGFIHSLSKTDNFKVKVQEVPKYFELWVTREISELYYVNFYVNYTIDGDGNPSTINPVEPWTRGQLWFARTEGIYDVYRYETTFVRRSYIYWKFYMTNSFTWVSDTYGPELIDRAGMVNKLIPPVPLKTFSLTIEPPIEDALYFANYTYYDDLGNPIGGSHTVPLTTRTDNTFSGSAYIAGIIMYQFYIEKPPGTEIWRSETQGPETIPPGTTPIENKFYLSSISGYKFEDQNQDGDKDIGEQGLGCWTINLFRGSPTGTPIATTHTREDGFFRFDLLIAGTYYLSETVKNGWFPTTSLPIGPITIPSDAAVEITDQNIGNFYEMLKITDTSDYRCPLSWFDIVFTPSNEGSGRYKFSSTNPGSFYFNVVKYGTAGNPVTILANLPPDQENAYYDSPNFILHHTYIGSSSVVDVHVYGGRLASPCGGYWIPDWSKDITSLFSITATPNGKSVTVSGNIPSTGIVFVTIHIDYQISGSLTRAQAQSFSAFEYTFSVGSVSLEFPVNTVKLPLSE